MRVAAVLILLAALTVPAAAQSSIMLPYNLTFSDGTITGTFGGVPVSGTYSGGTFTLTVDGKTFASGTYTCSNGTCTYTVTTILGSFKSATFTSTDGVASGSLSGLYANHGGWVSSVARWANTNLTGVRRGQVVSAAAKIQGKGQNSSTSTATTEHSGKGRGASHRH